MGKKTYVTNGIEMKLTEMEYNLLQSILGRDFPDNFVHRIEEEISLLSFKKEEPRWKDGKVIMPREYFYLDKHYMTLARTFEEHVEVLKYGLRMVQIFNEVVPTEKVSASVIKKAEDKLAIMEGLKGIVQTVDPDAMVIEWEKGKLISEYLLFSPKYNARIRLEGRRDVHEIKLVKNGYKEDDLVIRTTKNLEFDQEAFSEEMEKLKANNNKSGYVQKQIDALEKIYAADNANVILDCTRNYSGAVYEDVKIADYTGLLAKTIDGYLFTTTGVNKGHTYGQESIKVISELIKQKKTV